MFQDERRWGPMHCAQGWGCEIGVISGISGFGGRGEDPVHLTWCWKASHIACTQKTIWQTPQAPRLTAQTIQFEASQELWAPLRQQKPGRSQAQATRPQCHSVPKGSTRG